MNIFDFFVWVFVLVWCVCVFIEVVVVDGEVDKFVCCYCFGVVVRDLFFDACQWF